jgi:neutral ceramidase|tara:strand:+ start:14244 stop:16424 length:2181 start_codon:yes stop_codon:yes gene_type:complete
MFIKRFVDHSNHRGTDALVNLQGAPKMEPAGYNISSYPNRYSSSAPNERLQQRIMNFWLRLSLILLLFSGSAGALSSQNYLIGRGMADITGPAFGIQMWGFGREDQLTEGLHFRLRTRAFIIGERTSKKARQGRRLVFVSADIGSIEHNMVLEVIDRLQAKYGELYSLDNVILSATHTHAGAGGYWHSRTEFALSGAFYPAHYNKIIEGIVDAIVFAHDDLQPGRILINTGKVEAAGVNRSVVAYLQNPERERAAFADNTDKDMTLLKFVDDSGDIGMINWFAVHPTSMTYNNRLISGDHKGYASLEFERRKDVSYNSKEDFVAAFAQSNAGDVTANLNLDNTGPGTDDFESTRIIGARQLAVAEELFENASELLEGDIDYRQIYVDLSSMKVDESFTQAGTQTTCPSAYGYTFAAGSTEDGGGHFLFEEGMVNQNFILDFLIRFLTGAPEWTPEVKRCQEPKAILFETGTGTVPLQSQIRAITVARIGQLAILALPAEVTTMAGRRLRKTVLSQLGGWARYIVIAGYANGYAGYITTPEEYQTQQYEGGHTLHGKWTLPAYQEISSYLAKVLENGDPVEGSIAYDDWRGRSTEKLLEGGEDTMPESVSHGEAFPLTHDQFVPGDLVISEFWSANPNASFGTNHEFLRVEHKRDKGWVTTATESDWSTRVRWRRDDRSGSFIATIKWQIPYNQTLGEYRIRHLGVYQSPDDQHHEFESTSETFIIR